MPDRPARLGRAPRRRHADGHPPRLRAYTAGSAYQAFEPDEAALRPGAPADLVLLDADPWTVPASELAAVGVRATWRGGVRTC